MRNLSQNKQTVLRESGAVVLEFALIAGIFFFALLALFDFTRFYSLQAVLTKGAQNGLEVAKVIDGLRIDLENLSMDCEANPATLPACQSANFTLLQNARLEVITAATNFPLATFASLPQSGGNFELNEYEFTDTPAQFASNPPLPQLAATVIRPGETAFNKTKNLTIEHPQICPINAATCTGNRERRQSTETLEGLYRSYPIVVQVQAQFKPLFPFWNPINIVGQAVGYRELNTGAIPSDLPPLLACQTPPICISPMVANANCGCDCTNTCAAGEAPNPSTCLCECDTTRTCTNGQVFNPTACACQCPSGSPTSAIDCNAGQNNTHWTYANCECSCPGNLDSICINNYNPPRRYNRNTCKCSRCTNPNDPECAGSCALSQLARQCAQLNPPQGINAAECDCANECINPVPCTGGIRTSCTTCSCPNHTCIGAKRPDTRDGVCGACICPPSSEVGQGCPTNKPNANQRTCLCEAPGSGPSS